jgi:hypothetical protein
MDPVPPVTKTVFLAGEDIWSHPRTEQVQARSLADRGTVNGWADPPLRIREPLNGSR